MLCNVLGCLLGSEDTRKTPSILSRKIRALGVLCVSCSLPSRETARRGGGGSQRRSRVVGEQPCLDGASVGVTVSDWAWPEDVVGRSHR